MNSSTVPWNQVAIIRPSGCHRARKRSHISPSRRTTQFSTASRTTKRSNASLFMVAFLPPATPLWRRPTHCPNVSPDASRRVNMARLEGRTAIVTGGAKGIGRHYSQALAAEGAQVMIADIADGKELAAEIAAKHGRNSTDSMVFDVSDEAQCMA